MKKWIWAIGFIAAIAIPTYGNSQEPKEFTLKVTNDDVNLIGKALGKQPFDDVAGLIQKLRQQIVEQQQPAKPVMPPVEAPK